MSLFYINEETCERCGICMHTCPVGIITMEEPRAIPNPVPGAEGICIRCGHCVTVCPHGSLTLATMPIEECPKIDRALLPSLEEFAEMIRSRRSIRVYKEKPVAKERLAVLIEVARHAPTGKNTQLLHWLIIQGRVKLDPLVAICIDWMRDMVAKEPPMAKTFGMGGVIQAWEAGADPILRGSPVLVVLHAPKEYPGGFVDATIALTTYELAAFSDGLGTCWAGFFQIAASMWPPLLEALDLPADHLSCGAMMTGHPKYRYQRVPTRKPASISWR